MKTTRMKELIRILMESSLYFDLPLRERRDLIRRLMSGDRIARSMGQVYHARRN
jgi:hypothetical protein